jgi:hypothetical protein
MLATAGVAVLIGSPGRLKSLAALKPRTLFPSVHSEKLTIICLINKKREAAVAAPPSDAGERLSKKPGAGC